MEQIIIFAIIMFVSALQAIFEGITKFNCQGFYKHTNKFEIIVAVLSPYVFLKDGMELMKDISYVFFVVIVISILLTITFFSIRKSLSTLQITIYDVELEDVKNLLSKALEDYGQNLIDDKEDYSPNTYVVEDTKTKISIKEAAFRKHIIRVNIKNPRKIPDLEEILDNFKEMIIPLRRRERNMMGLGSIITGVFILMGLFMANTYIYNIFKSEIILETLKPKL